MKKLYTTARICLLGIMVFAFAGNNGYSQCFTSTGPTNDCSYGDAVDVINIDGNVVSNAGCSNPSGYSFFPTPVWNFQLGASYPLSIDAGGGLYDQGLAIWIDMNDDGILDPSENVWLSTAPAMNHTGTLNIPVTGVTDTVVMRIMCTYNTNPTATDACVSGIGGYGETEDYLVLLSAPVPVGNAEATALVTPMNNDCGEVSDSVVVRVTNTGTATLMNIPIVTNLSGMFTGTYNDTVPTLGPMASADVFVTTFDSQAGGTLDVQFYVSGADSDPSNDTLSTSVTILNSTDLTITGMDTVCNGDSSMLTLNVVGGETYTWYLDSVGGTVAGMGDTIWTSPLTAAAQYVVTSSNTCRSASSPFTVSVIPLPTASFTSSGTNDMFMFTGTATGYTTLVWDFGDGNNDNTLSPTHVYGQTGMFWVCFTAINATCGDSATFCDSVNSVVSTVNIPGYENGEISLYPNPTSGSVNVDLLNMAGVEGSWSLIDLEGRVMEQRNITLGTDNEKIIISLESYASGTYIFRFTTKERYSYRVTLIRK